MARPRMTNPIGTPERVAVPEVNVGTCNGDGGVKVGRWVGVGCTRRAEARVGSSVTVTRGVAVGGGSTIWRKPGESETSGA